MLDVGEVLFGLKFGHEFLEFFVGELCVVVDHYHMWYPEAGRQVHILKAEDVLCRDFGECFGLDPFSKVVYGDDQVFVLVRTDGKRYEDIHPLPNEGTWGEEWF